jgi:hypothetical protein
LSELDQPRRAVLDTSVMYSPEDRNANPATLVPLAPIALPRVHRGGGILTHFPDRGYRVVEVRDLPS